MELTEISTEELRGLFPFPEPREGQLEVIKTVLEAYQNGKKYVLLNASTGTGKSAIAITVARYMNKKFQDEKMNKSFILTTEKILQRQYSEDFKNNRDVSLLLGKSNYECNLNGDPYEEGPCHSMKDKNKVKELICYNSCDYRLARALAKISPIVISNYHYMLFDQDYLPKYVKIPPRELAIFDEAHNMESILLEYTTVGMSKDLISALKTKFTKITKLLGIRINILPIVNTYVTLMKMKSENSSDYIKYFENLKKEYENIVDSIEKYLNLNSARFYALSEKKELSKSEEQTVKSYKYGLNSIEFIRRTYCKICNMLRNYEREEWVVDKKEDKIEMKPIFATYLFEDSFAQMANKFLFMSATPPTKEIFSQTFNIPLEQIEEIEVPSTFPIENRRVYSTGLCSLSYSKLKENLPLVVDSVDELIQAGLSNGDNVMIHSGNYDVTDYILKNSKYGEKMIAPTPETRDECIEEFKNSRGGIMISPSLMEGLSLDDDYCRLQVIVKVPYLSLSDKRVKRRVELSGDWYKQQAIHKLVQACGRGVRNKDDYCETYVLDANFNYLLQRHPNLFPRWFMDAVEII